MPAPTPPSPGKQLFDSINQQLAQINAWIRTNLGMTPTYTEATLPASAREGQLVFVSDGGAGQRFRGWTGSEWVDLG